MDYFEKAYRSIGNNDIKSLINILNNHNFSNDSFDKIVGHSNHMYEINNKCYEYIINFIEKNNNIFNIFVSSIKKYNICDDILQQIGEYYGKYELNITIIDSYVAKNFELTKKILSLNKTINIGVALPSMRYQTDTIPLLYYLSDIKCDDVILEYFLKIGCDPNIKYKPNNRYHRGLHNYESLLVYVFDKAYNEKTIELIEKYGGRMSEEAQMYYCGKIIYSK